MSSKKRITIYVLILLLITQVFVFKTESFAISENISNRKEIITPLHYDETNKRLIKTEVIKQKPIGWADGQKENGHVFLGSYGSICWTPSGGRSISVSLGPNYGHLSIGVSVGIAFGSGASYCSTGLAPNVGWKLYTYADIEVKTYKVDFDYYGAKGTKEVYEQRVIKTYTKAIRVN